jgi:hypothetical protein
MTVDPSIRCGPNSCWRPQSSLCRGAAGKVAPPHQRSLDLRDGLFQDRGYPSDEMICSPVSARVEGSKIDGKPFLGISLLCIVFAHSLAFSLAFYPAISSEVRIIAQADA